MAAAIRIMFGCLAPPRRCPLLPFGKHKAGVVTQPTAESVLPAWLYHPVAGAGHGMRERWRANGHAVRHVRPRGQGLQNKRMKLTRRGGIEVESGPAVFLRGSASIVARGSGVRALQLIRGVRPTSGDARRRTAGRKG